MIKFINSNNAKTLIITYVLISIITIIFSKSKYINVIKTNLSILFIYLTISFLSPILMEFKEFSPQSIEQDIELNITENIINETQNNINKTIKSIISERFIIEEELINVSTTFDKKENYNFFVKNVTVLISKNDIDEKNISEYISNLIGTECIVLKK